MPTSKNFSHAHETFLFILIFDGLSTNMKEDFQVGVQRNWEKIFNFQAHIQTPYN